MGSVLEPFGAGALVQTHFRSNFQSREGMSFMPHFHPPGPVHLPRGMDLGWEFEVLAVTWLMNIHAWAQGREL